MEKPKVVFLCTGNSCRSQMAEAWIKEIAGDEVEAISAGIEDHSFNQYTADVMTEVGIDISGQYSKCVNIEMLEWADLVVTLCDNAEEQCPIISFDTAKLHLPLADPAKIKGDDEEVRTVFRQTRDKVKQRVDFVLTQLHQFSHVV